MVKKKLKTKWNLVNYLILYQFNKQCLLVHTVEKSITSVTSAAKVRNLTNQGHLSVTQQLPGGSKINSTQTRLHHQTKFCYDSGILRVHNCSTTIVFNFGIIFEFSILRRRNRLSIIPAQQTNDSKTMKL